MEYLSLALLVCVGLGLLVAGGEVLTQASSKLATYFGIRPIIIGLTIVAFGTSTPEAFVSVLASLEKNPDISIANVVGSNIFNIAFILGLSALVNPLSVHVNSIKREIPFVVGSAVLVWILGRDGVLGRIDGIILLMFFCLFLFVCLRSILKEETNHAKKIGNKIIQGLFIIFSLVLLVVGAKLLVSGSIEIAEKLGVSSLVIGLTIVAAGTSFPELATSVMASIKKKDDIAIGNVTGSNIFNILFILGLSALVLPLTVSEAMINRDIPIMIGLSILSVPFMKSGFRINRIEGLVLLLIYVGYTVVLIRS